jgi:predicted CoA-substrate-specific enzyme activase
MYLSEVNGGHLHKHRPARPVAGIDIGSRAAKGVLLTPEKIHVAQIVTGLSMQQTADDLLERLLRVSGLDRSQIAYIVGTGYGRISIQFDDIPYRVVTEITCHALGAHALNPLTRTVIDIGGQDSKAIKVNPANGKVVEFVMNDKCAAGTGRFLEKAAVALGLELDRLGEEALKAREPAIITSQCVVFAESEVISLKARGGLDAGGDVRANIAAGIHYSAARRVKNLLGRVGIEPELVFSGGVSNNPGMWHVLEEILGAPFVRPDGIDMIYAGALGAAVQAGRYIRSRTRIAVKVAAPLPPDLRALQAAIESEKQAFLQIGGSKKVGYLCVYTPPELLNAAGIRAIRLFQGGDAETAAHGELYTQSVACDFSKSCIGAFEKGDPLFRAVDKIYNFHTCAAMKRTSEVLEQFVPTQLYSLPKLRAETGSRNFYRDEIRAFHRDLEALTGREISAAALHEQIVLSNKLRRILKKISELRKRPAPAIGGSEYLDLVRAYYYLPPQKALPHFAEIYRRLRDLPDQGGKTVRLMLSGSIVADGDRRLLQLIEGEIGARVVVEDHCTGLRPFYRTVRESGDPFQALAEGYLDQPPCARMKPLDDSIEFSLELAQEYDVEGVVFLAQKFCACYALPQKLFLDGFQRLNLPVLTISGDYSASDHGQLKTRVEAFIDVIREKRSKESEPYAGV